MAACRAVDISESCNGILVAAIKCRGMGERERESGCQKESLQMPSREMLIPTTK